MDFDRIINYDIPLEEALKNDDYARFIEKGCEIIEKSNIYLYSYNLERNKRLFEAKRELGSYISKKLNNPKLQRGVYTEGGTTGSELFVNEVFGKALFRFLLDKYNNTFSFPFFNELLSSAIEKEILSDYLIMAYKKLSPRLFLPLFQTYFKECEDNDSRWTDNLDLQREIAKNLMYLECNNYSDDKIYLYCKPFEYTPPIIWQYKEYYDRVWGPTDFENSEITLENENIKCDVVYASYMGEYHARIEIKENDLIYTDKRKEYALYFLESFPNK